jgi:hypothetical protein
MPDALLLSDDTKKEEELKPKIKSLELNLSSPISITKDPSAACKSEASVLN